MPPKAKITKEMIVDTAFHIARAEGADKITARKISEQLHCSTQPVLYYFATVEEIKQAVYEKADQYHTDFLMNMEKDYGNPLLSMGMNYIRFSIEERNLFRLLFQSNEFSGRAIWDLTQQENVEPIVAAFRQEMELSGEQPDISQEQVTEIFSTLFIFVHGYASMYANNDLVYDEAELQRKLEKAFMAAVIMEQEDFEQEVDK